MNKFLSTLLFLGLSLLPGFGKGLINMNILRPSTIMLPRDVETIVLIDRTLAKDQKADKVERIITGEVFKTDEQCVANALSSFEGAFNSSGVYAVTRASGRLSNDQMRGAMPRPLPWNTIEEHCTKANAQVALVIESFDSDFVITHGTGVRKITDPSGTVRTIPSFTARGVAKVTMGVRVYYPSSRTIVDEYTIVRNGNWEAGGATLPEAMASLMDRQQALINTAGLAAEDYAYRITPSWIRVQRIFYKKPKRNDYMAQGVRQFQVNDWEPAIESFRKAYPQLSGKKAGKAAYNLAVGLEIMGQLQEAYDWANKAYVMHGLKDAREYARILQNRIRDEAVLNR